MTEEHALDLPPVEEVERSLGLDEEDRRDLPGLHRLNTVKIPLARLMAFSLALLILPFHNLAVLGGVDWKAFVVVALVVEAYCLGSWWILQRFFARVKGIHLGTFFVATDLLVITALVHASGGPSSLYWPIYFVRVADQIWISQRRAVLMAVAGVALYAGLIALWSLQGEPLVLSREVVKLVVLGGMSAALTAVARQPWNVQTRTQAAKELILQLEEQSRELDRERQRAERASRAKSDFLARMSHELRTPLNSVVGFTNVLLKNRESGMASRELDYLQRIRQNGMHLLALINDILDLARIEEGRMEIQLGSVDLRELVRDTADQLEGRTLGSDVRLTMSVPDRLRPIRADEARLRQVLINLMGNALKFTDHGSVHVEVTAHDDGRPDAIHVRDTGVGIPRESLPHIFNAFEQVEEGHARRHGGTGLGLAISRSLCTLMGFELTARSEVGRGSTFSVLLPPAAAFPDETRGAAAAADQARRAVASDDQARRTVASDDQARRITAADDGSVA